MSSLTLTCGRAAYLASTLEATLMEAQLGHAYARQLVRVETEREPESCRTLFELYHANKKQLCEAMAKTLHGRLKNLPSHHSDEVTNLTYRLTAAAHAILGNRHDRQMMSNLEVSEKEIAAIICADIQPPSLKQGFRDRSTRFFSSTKRTIGENNLHGMTLLRENIEFHRDVGDQDRLDMVDMELYPRRKPARLEAQMMDALIARLQPR